MSFGKLNFSTSLKPTSAFPLDARTYFDSLEKAQLAASSAKPVGSTESIYYIGQTLTVVEGDLATLYVIQPDLSLEQVGTGTATPAPNPGGGTTVVVTDIKWEDIKDKPFYDDSKSSICRFADGIPTVTTEFFNYKWYKISNITLTEDEILKTKFMTSFDGEYFYQETPSLNEIMFNESYMTAIVFEESGTAICICRKEGDHVVDYQGMQIPASFLETGIYFAYNINRTPPDTYVFKIEYIDIKKLDDKYVNHDWSAVKNKPFYEEGYHIKWDGKPTDTVVKASIGTKIEWDGSLTDVYIEVQENPDYNIPHAYSCKVAEPIEGTLDSYKFTVAHEEGSYTDTIYSDSIVIERDESGEVLYSANSDYWVINFNKAGEYNLLGILDITIEEPGVYFMVVPDQSLYIQSLYPPDYQEMSYYKVSDSVSSIINAYATLRSYNYDEDEGGYLEEVVQLNDQDVGGMTVTALGNEYPTYAPYGFNIVAPEYISVDMDGAILSVSFEEPGLYLLNLGEGYISSMMSEGYEIYPLNEKFIPDSIARKDRVPEAYEIGTCIEWDIPEEITEDDVLVDVGPFADSDSAVYIKVAEPLRESIVGWKVILQSIIDGKEMETPPITEEDGAQIYESGSISLGYAVNVVTPETLYIEVLDKEVEFSVAGLYFVVLSEIGYTTKLLSPDYDVVKIDPKFLPEMNIESGGSIGDIGCPVLNLGTLSNTDSNYVIADVYSVMASGTDIYNLDYSKGAYPQYDTFIIPFFPSVTVEPPEGSEEITIHIATGYSSSGVTSSFPVRVNTTHIESGLIYSMWVNKYSDGTYKGHFILRTTTKIDGSDESRSSVATAYSVYNYIRSLGLSQIDELPQEYSNGLVRSKGIFKAIKDKADELVALLQQSIVQADINETDPRSPSYVKNKILYNEPIYDNIYINSPPSGTTTSNTPTSSFNGSTGYYAKVATLPIDALSSSDTLYQYAETIDNIEMQDLLKDEVFEIVKMKDWGYAIKGTVNIKDSLVVIIGSSGYYSPNGTSIRFRESGLYVLRVSTPETMYYVNTIKFKTTPHKLSNDYLDLDDSPKEGSQKPISSDAVYRAILGGQGTLQFDETPTEGSTNLLTSGAIHKALSELDGGGSGTLPDADDIPIEGSQNLVKSGGVHRAIESLREDINESLDEKVTQSDIDSAINPLQKEIGNKANTSDVYSKSEIDSTVNTFRTDLGNKANASDVYSKEEIDGKLTGAFHYLGTKDNYSDLPTENNNVGDVWNILNADTTHAVKAGDNVAWNGTSWDVLSGMVDLSAYAKQSAVDEQSRKLNTIEEGANKYTHPAKHSIGEVDGLDEALEDKIDTDLLGIASGVATLDENGKIPDSQMPRTYRIATDEEIDALFNKT